MRLRWYNDTLWSKILLFVIFALASVFLFAGCKTKIIPMEKVVNREVVRYDTLRTIDSVYTHDSVWCYQKGDTLYRDRWHEKVILKNVYKTKIDSFIRRDSIPVPYPVERKLSKWEQIQLKWASWWMGALCVIFVYIGYLTFKRIKNGRYNNTSTQG